MNRLSVTARGATLAAACAIGVSGLVAAPSADATGPASATVRVGGPAAVAPTSTRQGFLGLATSLSTIPALAGQAAAPNTPFVNLVTNLSPGAPPILRLGGNSGDDSWWPTPVSRLATSIRSLRAGAPTSTRC